MATNTEPGTLAGLLKSHNLPENIYGVLSEAPYRITTIGLFANYFETKGEVGTVFVEAHKDLFKDRGDFVAGLKQAWREAEAITARGLKRTIDDCNTEALDEPLKHDEQTKLEKVFKAEYKMLVPPLWMGFPAMLGRFHREFLRRTHTTFHVNKVRNLEGVVSQGVGVKHQRMGNIQMSFGEDTKQAEAPVGNVFSYVLGLKAVLYTMAMAGTFKVTRDSKEVLFAPLECLLEHLAACEGYILRHSTGREPIPEFLILRQLTVIDEGVRGEWARIIRSNSPDGVTLGEAVKDTAHFAAALFLMAPVDKNQKRQTNNDTPFSPGRGTKGAPQGKGQGKNHIFSNSPQAPGNRRESLAEKYEVKFKTCRYTSDGKHLCKPFNDPRGCKNPSCPEEHRCDYLTPGGKACGGNHPRADHRGPKVPL